MGEWRARERVRVRATAGFDSREEKGGGARGPGTCACTAELLLRAWRRGNPAQTDTPAPNIAKEATSTPTRSASKCAGHADARDPGNLYPSVIESIDLVLNSSICITVCRCITFHVTSITECNAASTGAHNATTAPHPKSSFTRPQSNRANLAPTIFETPWNCLNAYVYCRLGAREHSTPWRCCRRPVL